MADAIELPPLPPLEGLRTAEDFRAAGSILYNRWNFFNQAGLSFGGKRDTYQILGYDRILSTAQYRSRYERSSLAGALVDIMPDDTWRGTVEVREDKDAKTDTELEKTWKALDQRLQIQAKMLRVDKLSRLSHYAVLLIGVKGTGLDTELPRGTGPDSILYLKPYSGNGGPAVSGSNTMQNRSAGDAMCTIQSLVTETSDPRFGQPLTYRIKNVSQDVHWSRILHVAEGCLEDDVYGQPALERVWNLFDDLDKVTGGGAEAFWLRANAGLHLDVDKDMALPKPAAGEPSELDKLKQAAEDYAHQMTRMMRTKGVRIEQLGSDVANFSLPADAIITQIAGAKRMPKRILTGSEMGELASSQDRDNWRDQVNGRQTSYAGPYIMRPLIDRLVKFGYLPAPSGGPDVYDIIWPHLQTMTEQEKDTRAVALASVNQTAGETVFTNAEIRDMSHGRAPLESAEIKPVGAPAGFGNPEQVPVEQPLAVMAEHEDEEILRVLEAAIVANNTDVIEQIIGVRR